MKRKIYLSSLMICLATSTASFFWLSEKVSQFWQQPVIWIGSLLLGVTLSFIWELLLTEKSLNRVRLCFVRLTLPKLITRTTAGTDNQLPPKFAEYLLYFLPKKDREPLLGDLEEEYRGIYKKFGKKQARFWYYYQVGTSFWPYIMNVIKKLIGWGVVGWVGSAIRRLIG